MIPFMFCALHYVNFLNGICCKCLLPTGLINHTVAAKTLLECGFIQYCASKILSRCNPLYMLILVWIMLHPAGSPSIWATLIGPHSQNSGSSMSPPGE